MTINITFLKRFGGIAFTLRRPFCSGMAGNLGLPRDIGPTYRWQERVEDLENYCTGGYHPIQLDDKFSNGRYRVLHKLGYGTFSTVWLARDYIKNRYVALKVITAAASRLSSEAKIRRHLRDGKTGHPGHSYVLALLDEFLIDGPNGRHLCLVSEVIGASIGAWKEATRLRMLPIQTARDVTPQIALGLAYIHSCGILHGGQYFLLFCASGRFQNLIQCARSSR